MNQNSFFLHSPLEAGDPDLDRDLDRDLDCDLDFGGDPERDLERAGDAEPCLDPEQSTQKRFITIYR